MNDDATKIADDVSIEDKLQAAKEAMEGPERTAKRAEEEKARSTSEQKGKFEKELAALAKEKEQLEIAWVTFDDQRKAIRLDLNPLLEKEKQIEEAEAKLETEEVTAVVPQTKQAVEKKRWLIQDQRKEVEKTKWGLQEKLWQMEAEIDKNTKHYRELLTQEDKLQEELKKLNA